MVEMEAKWLYLCSLKKMFLFWLESPPLCTVIFMETEKPFTSVYIKLCYRPVKQARLE